MNGDLTFPTGTVYVLVIDTDSYAGNFEREIAGYVAGAYDDHRGHGGKELARFLSEATEEGWSEEAELLRDAVTTVTHDEYGEVSNTIWPTPGRLNNGKGQCYDADETEKGWPAYESAAVFFSRSLMHEEMKRIRERAQKFCDTYCDIMGRPQDLKLKAVRVLEITTAQTQTQLDI